MTAEEKIHNPYGVAPGQRWQEIKTGRVVRVLAVSLGYASLTNTATGQYSSKRLIAFKPSQWRRIDTEEAKT